MPMTASTANTSRQSRCRRTRIPTDPALRKQRHRHAQAAVSAELHHHAGQQHRSGGRRGHVTGRRPGVKRPQARENCEPDKHQRKRPHLKAHGKRHFASSTKSRRVAARSRIRREQADQHHRAADERVERQLHRAVFAPRRTPDRDEEILRDDRDFVEHKQQEQIEAEEHAIHAADEREVERKELLRRDARCSRRTEPRRPPPARQQHQHEADAVRRQSEVNAQRWHPRQIHQRHASLPCARGKSQRPRSRSPPPPQASATHRARAALPFGRSISTSTPANEMYMVQAKHLKSPVRHQVHHCWVDRCPQSVAASTQSANIKPITGAIDSRSPAVQVGKAPPTAPAPAR